MSGIKPAPCLLLLLLALVGACAPRGPELWRSTYDSAGKLDHYAEGQITDPQYHRVIVLQKDGRPIHWHLAGPVVLRKVCKRGAQCSYTKDGVTHIYNLAGPLPNGRMYLSQWGVGHEWGHILGIEVDQMMIPAQDDTWRIFDHKK